MSVQSEIDRISGNISDSLDAVASKGVAVPAGANSDSLAGLIRSIEVGGGIEIVKLWQNASPGSFFGAQTLFFDTTQYDAIEIEWAIYVSDSGSPSRYFIGKYAKRSASLLATAMYAGHMVERFFAVYSDGIVFENGGMYLTYAGNASARSQVMVPMQIYGVKGTTSLPSGNLFFNYGDLASSGGFTEHVTSGNLSVGTALTYQCKQYVFGGGYHSNNTIDVTNFSKLRIYGTGRNVYGSTVHFRAGLGSMTTVLDAYVNIDETLTSYTLDISSLTGSKYFVVDYLCNGAASQVTSNIYRIELVP